MGITGPSLAYGAQRLLPEYSVSYQTGGTINDLISNIDNGTLTIVGVSWQTNREIAKIINENWYDKKFLEENLTIGHWMVVAGYNNSSNHIILLDPGNESKWSGKFSYNEFIQIWAGQSNFLIGAGDIIIFNK